MHPRIPRGFAGRPYSTGQPTDSVAKPSAFTRHVWPLILALALLAEPPCLIFDEAASALDTLSEQLISQAIEHNLGDRTAIFIAHRLSTVKHCDGIFVLQAGRLVQVGNHAELVASDGLFRDLVQGQQLRD